MKRAEIDALQRTPERDQGDYTRQPRDPLVKPPVGARRGEVEGAPPGESIAEGLEALGKENPRNVRGGGMDEACRDIGVFMEAVGPGVPVGAITKKPSGTG